MSALPAFPSPRPQLEGENSPPGQNNGNAGGSGSPPPGGVGSPSKNATRNTSASPKTKASALPSKTKQKPLPQVPSPVAPSSAPRAAGAATGDKTAATAVAGSKGEDGADVLGDQAAAGGRESRESGGCWGGSKGKVVVAVSRRVSVLRVSTAGSRR